jgi:putative PEP-CTERM system histidine kinase
MSSIVPVTAPAAILFFSAGLGCFCALLIALIRRFGPGSWLLGFFMFFSSLVPATLTFASGADASLADMIFGSAVSFMLLAAPFGLFFSWSINHPNYRQILSEKKRLVSAIIVPVPLLLLCIYAWRPRTGGIPLSEGFVSLGPGGYLACLYLLIVSIMALSSLEQIIRCAEERVRWEAKFLVLGLGSSFAAAIYVASKALLYSFQNAVVPKDAFYVFALILPVSSLLILASWRRSSGHARFLVSQGLIYSSITLLSVGAYLIASAILARWVSSHGELGLQSQVIIFLLSIIVLATLLLWTSFRHRVRNWIRQNIFAGKYDYRHLWMEATEKVRSVDGPEHSALALASLVQRALGAIDISVWLRSQDPERLTRIAALGSAADYQVNEIKGILEEFVQIADPIEVGKVNGMPENTAINSFCAGTHAALLVPLCSSGRLVGLLTVGSDRSGRLYNWEAREFLRVLASHAASEFHKRELLGTLVAAKEAEAFKSFSTFLLHDLKNFASTLSLIAKNAGRHQSNPDFQRDAFHSIFDTAEKMKRLCNNLRTFSSSLAVNRKECDFNEIVRSVLRNLNIGLSRRLRLEFGKLPLIFADQEEVSRVLQNLVLNAREATSPEGSITIRTRHLETGVELAVIDDGVGMTEEFIRKELFLPFHTTKSDGLGIGLFQCKKIIEAHGGFIQIDSEERKGTVVRIGFPIAAGNHELDSRQQVRSEQ